MTSQANHQRKEAVKRIVLDPMMRMYQPPSHLRNDKQAFITTLDEYQNRLAGFSDATLAKAWDAVKDEHEVWIWPHLKVIRTACMKLAPASQTVEANVGYPWILKAEKAEALANDYIKQFSTSALMEKAKSEGWHEKLKAYVASAAKAQASIICGEQNWGYNNAVYQWEHNTKPNVISSRIKAFLEATRTQAAKGFIEVQVPNEAMEAWRVRAKGIAA